MHHSQAFNLAILSKFPFPELISHIPVTPDVRINYGSLPARGLNTVLKQGAFFQLNDKEMWLNIPKIARFLIVDGKEIIIDRCEDIDEATLRKFILDSCFKALLSQKYLFAVQGSVIKIGSYAVSFIAPSGFGKSTLSSLFLKKGYSILSDEICAIDDDLNVLPSYPEISLWATVAQQLGIDVSTLKKIRPNLDKYAINIREQFHATPLPIKIIYHLNYQKNNTLKVSPLSEKEKIEFLQNQLFNCPYVSLSKHKEIVEKSQAIAHQVEVIHLECPRWDFSMNEMGHLLSSVFDEIEVDLLSRGVTNAA